MSNDNVKVDLNPMPDGYGFIYGQARRGEDHFNVNVMPPKAHWQGQFELPDYEPHETDWVFYVDGEEVGRMSDQPDLIEQFSKLLQQVQ